MEEGETELLCKTDLESLGIQFDLALRSLGYMEPLSICASSVSLKSNELSSWIEGTQKRLV